MRSRIMHVHGTRPDPLSWDESALFGFAEHCIGIDAFLFNDPASPCPSPSPWRKIPVDLRVDVLIPEFEKHKDTNFGMFAYSLLPLKVVGLLMSRSTACDFCSARAMI